VFKPGHAKLGGRQKGTPNKTSATVREMLAASGVDPIQEILTLIPTLLGSHDRVQVWLKLLPYCYPTLRSVDLSLDPDAAIGVNVGNVAALWAVAREEAMKHAAVVGDDSPS